MGLLDNIKGALKGNADKVQDGIEKAADVIDDKTDGKYSDQIDMAEEKIGDVVEGLAEEGEDASEA